jgi:hypothetical protein
VCSGMTGGSGLGVCAATSHQSINQHIPTLNYLHIPEHSTWLDCSEASTPVLVHPPTRCCFSLPAAAKLRPGALQAVAFKFASHPRWYSCVQKKACTLQQHSPFCGVHRSESNAGVVNKVPVIASPRASAPLASSTHAEVAHEPRATSGVHLPLDNKPDKQRFWEPSAAPMCGFLPGCALHTRAPASVSHSSHWQVAWLLVAHMLQGIVEPTSQRPNRRQVPNSAPGGAPPIPAQYHAVSRTTAACKLYTGARAASPLPAAGSRLAPPPPPAPGNASRRSQPDTGTSRGASLEPRIVCTI